MSRVKQIVGLDLGTRSVRAAWVSLRGGSPHIVRCEQMVLPLDSPDPLPLIRTWLEQLGLTGGFAALALPGAQAVFQPGRLAPEDPRTPQQAAAMEIATFNDMAGDSMTYAVAGHEWRPGARVYLMAMARPAVIARALETVEPLGIRPADLVPAPVALFAALDRLAGTHAAPFLYLNIGHTQTELAIGSSTGLLFARAVPSGGRAFTEAIAQAEKIPVPQAEVRKHREASLLPNGPFGELLRPLAERWWAQVAACLSVYRGAFGGEPFALGQIVLSGGGAQLRGLPEFVRARSDLPVLAADALSGAAALPQAGTYDVAAGLALTALEVTGTHLSVLPAKLRDEIVFREKKPYWIAASVVGALTLGVFTVGMVLTLRGEARALEAERTALRRREQLDQGMTAIRKRSDDLRLRAEPLRDLLQGGPMMRDVLSLVANAIHPDDWISMICEESSYLPAQPGSARPAPPAAPRPSFFLSGFRGVRPAAPAPAAKAAANPAPPASAFRVFIVEGYTPDPSLESVNRMILRLRTAARVRKVDLLSDDRVLPPTLPDELSEADIEMPDMRRFLLRLEVKP